MQQVFWSCLIGISSGFFSYARILQFGKLAYIKADWLSVLIV